MQTAVYGWFLYIIGPSLTFLLVERDLSRTAGSFLGMALALGGMTAGFFVTALARRFGRGPVLRAGSALVAGGMIAFGLGPHIGVALLALFIGGFGGTLIIVTVNAFLLQHQGAATDTALAETNTLASLFCLLGPLSVGFGAAMLIGGWRLGPFAVALAFLAVEIWRGRDLRVYAATPVAAPTATEAPVGSPSKLPTVYWWAMATLVLLVGVEFTISLWGAELLRERAGLAAAAAAVSLVCVVGGMAVGRAIGARLLETVPPEPLFIGSIVLALVGFTAAWATANPPLMIAALAVTGIGMGLHWPVGIARALRASGGHPERAGAYVSIGVSLATGVAPLALGLLADGIGLHAAFLIVPGLLTAALVLTIARTVPRVVPVSE